MNFLQTGLIMTFAIFFSSGTSVKHNSCSVTGTSLYCQGTFPTNIAGGIHDVYIRADHMKELSQQLFLHNSWRNVTKLDLTVDVRHIYNDTFSTLRNVQTLGFHAFSLVHIDIGGFSGLSRLATLDLSGCARLGTETLVHGLMYIYSELPKLRMLNLENICSDTGNALTFHVNGNFMNMLNILQIEHLKLNRSILTISDINSSNIENHIKHIDISHTIIVAQQLDLPNSSIVKAVATLKTLNVSFNPIRASGHFSTIILDQLPDTNTIYCQSVFALIENFYFDFMFSSYGMRVINVTQNASHCNYKLKLLSLRGNNIRILDYKYIWPAQNYVDEMLLSSNQIELLSPDLFINLHNLTKLDLSKNRLFKMEEVPEFQSLLWHLTSLKDFKVSSNQLSEIPKKMFKFSNQMEVIDLSDNKLEMINFDLESLRDLKVLDISTNNIKFISEPTLMTIRFMINLKNVENSSVKLNFHDNPLTCSCASVNFVTLLVQSLHLETDKPYYCNLEGTSIPVNSDAIKKSEYLCVRLKIIMSLSISMSVVVIVCVLLIIFITLKVKQRNKELRKRNFLRRFVNGAEKEKMIAFLSYNTENDNLEYEDEIHSLTDNLDRGIQEMVGTEENVICIPDRDFQIGLLEVDEISRCILDSCVVLLVVSEHSEVNFHISTTLTLAQYYLKPIVFVIRDGEQYRSRFIRKNIQRYTTIKVVNNEHQCVPEKGWDHLYNLIIELAVTNSKQNRANHVV